MFGFDFIATLFNRCRRRRPPPLQQAAPGVNDEPALPTARPPIVLAGKPVVNAQCPDWMTVFGVVINTIIGGIGNYNTTTELLELVDEQWYPLPNRVMMAIAISIATPIVLLAGYAEYRKQRFNQDDDNNDTAAPKLPYKDPDIKLTHFERLACFFYGVNLLGNYAGVTTLVVDTLTDNNLWAHLATTVVSYATMWKLSTGLRLSPESAIKAYNAVELGARGGVEKSPDLADWHHTVIEWLEGLTVFAGSTVSLSTLITHLSKADANFLEMNLRDMCFALIATLPIAIGAGLAHGAESRNQNGANADLPNCVQWVTRKGNASCGFAANLALVAAHSCSEIFESTDVLLLMYFKSQEHFEKHVSEAGAVSIIFAIGVLGALAGIRSSVKNTGLCDEGLRRSSCCARRTGVASAGLFSGTGQTKAVVNDEADDDPTRKLLGNDDKDIHDDVENRRVGYGT